MRKNLRRKSLRRKSLRRKNLMILPMNIEISFLDSGQVDQVREQVVQIYREAFSQPPYNQIEAHVAGFSNTLDWHFHRQGFRFAAAVQAGSGRLAGFAYGYDSLPGQWWHDTVAREMEEAMTRNWLENAFELVELAVSPSFQGRGIGGSLHDRILSGLANQTALLSTMQAETNALHLYRKRGWVTLLDYFNFPGNPNAYLIMGLDLRPRPQP
jgi:ribosomal protein S18 acetylase RimI-like enzyme